MSASVLVVGGDGLNCERETLSAFEQVGFKGDIVHISRLIENQKSLENYQVLAIPGGFSFGDEILSGRILSLKFSHYLNEAIERFRSEDKLILGICNGFQVLIQLGILPLGTGKIEATLTQNQGGRFVDNWTPMRVNQSSHCVWTRDLGEECWLPVRHGEGRLLFNNEDTRKVLLQKHLVALRYQNNFNGSELEAAGITDETGKILGLMPHPEAAMNPYLFPRRPDVAQKDFGTPLFTSAYKWFL